MKFRLKLAAAALLTIGLSSGAAFADSITFTLLNPNGHAPYTGGTQQYYATVSAPTSNGAAVFLNGDSFNFSGPGLVNDSSFFSTFPLSLAPGTTFTGNLFSLALPSGSPFGTFLGTFTLLGGSNGNVYNTLGTVNFSIATTPEPSSVVLMLTGMAGLAIAFWGRSKGGLRVWAR